MKKLYIILVLSLCCHITFYPFFHGYLLKRPLKERLGYIPDSDFFRASLGEFRWSAGYFITLKAMSYYGGKVINIKKDVEEDIEYENLFKTLKNAIYLNPYSETSYYFAQALFPWEKGMVKDVNELLLYVKKYRKWDFRIPLFLGYNHAFFLKDYGKAALYFQEAAKLSGNYLFASLSAKYLMEQNEEDLALSFLEEMYKEAKDEVMKKHYLLRIETVKLVKELNMAVHIYRERFGKNPKNLTELVSAGIIRKVPPHPRGGKFFIDEKGRVKSSK